MGFACAFFYGACRKEAPPEPDTPKPGKQDYVWPIDTLDYPGSFQTGMRSMYATNKCRKHSIDFLFFSRLFNSPNVPRTSSECRMAFVGLFKTIF